MRENLARALRLLLIVDDQLLRDRDPLAACQAAVRGGVTAVQVRCKPKGDAEVLQLARTLVATLAVPVFVNDRLDLALVARAVGVHLGADDLSPLLARTIASADFVIGASVGSHDELTRGEPADYWGVGPFRVSTTKPDAGAALGLERASAILARAGGRPCVLIGGILPEDVTAAVRAGFAGVAVASGILRHHDVEDAARRYAVRVNP